MPANQRKSLKAIGKQPEAHKTGAGQLAGPIQQQDQRKRKRHEPASDEDLELDEVAAAPARSSTAVHRIRFVDHRQNAAITGLGVCPLSWRPSGSLSWAREHGVMAAARENGNIEIYGWIRDADGAEEIGESSTLSKKLSKKGRLRGKNSDGSKQAFVLSHTLHGPVPLAPAEHVTFIHRTLLTPDEVELCDNLEEIEEEVTKLRRKTPRLLSTASGSEIWEWQWIEDTQSLNPIKKKTTPIGHIKQKLALPGGSICDMQPNPSHTIMATCSDDGSIHLISLTGDNDELLLVKTFERAANVRLLSLAWGVPNLPPSTDEYGRYSAQRDAYLVTGCSDSAIRKWAVSIGRVLSKMTLEKTNHQTHTFIWTVAVLKDHTIISGDSLGTVRFWDGKLDVQSKAYRSHKSDVLCLSVAANGETVYSSGSDQRACQFALVRTHDVEKWMLANTRRVHSHDVRALACSPQYSLLETQQSPLIQILLSGGLDMTIAETPCHTITHAPHIDPSTVQRSPLAISSNVSFQAGPHKRISHLQNTQFARYSRTAQLILLRREQGFTLWRASEDEVWAKLLDATLKCATTLSICEISQDGRWIIAGDSVSLRLWAVQDRGDEYSLKAYKSFQKLLTSINDRPTAYLSATFSPTSSAVSIGMAPQSESGTSLVVIRLPSDGKASCGVTYTHKQAPSAVTANGRQIAGTPNRPPANGNGKTNGVNGHHKSDTSSDSEESEAEVEIPSPLPSTSTAVSNTCFSTDGNLLAIESGRTIRIVDIQSPNGKVKTTLPTAEHPIIGLELVQLPIPVAMFLTRGHRLYVQEIESRTNPPWAAALEQSLRSLLRANTDQLVGLQSFPTANGAKIMCWSHTSIYLAEIGIESESTWKTLAYPDILHADFTSQGHLVVIERPYEDLVATLEPALYLPTYGNA